MGNNYVSVPIENRFWKNVNKFGSLHPSMQTNCWEWTGGFRGHYGRIGIGPRGAGTVSVHRLSWELKHGSIPNDLCVLHKCDNPSCVNPDHLFLGTKSDNNRDMVHKHRNSCGYGLKNRSSKLTPSDVRRSRMLYASGNISYRTLGAMFGIDAVAMRFAVIGKTWKHVK
jgi:hypothetical protein